MEIHTFCSVLLPALLLLFLWKKITSNRHLRFPPGPRRLPILGNLHQLGDCPHLSLHGLAKIHGPIMSLQFGSIPVLVISSADMAMEVIKNNDLAFTGRPAGAASRKLTYGCLDMVFSPYGEYWRRIRKICVHELLSTQRVQSFRSVREKEVAQLLDRIGRSGSDPTRTVNMSKLLLSLTNNIICTAAFGTKYGGDGGGGNRFQGIMGESQAILIGLSLPDFFPALEWVHGVVTGFHAKLEKAFKALDGFFEEVIEEHLDPNRPTPEQEDFVDVMLRVQKESEGQGLSRDQMKAVIMDLFLAGTDTTVATLVWSITEFIRHPHVMKKAQEEIRQVFKGKKYVEEENLHQLTYLKLVVKEVLRLHPPVPILVPRECTEQCKIDGYNIPLRTRVLVNVYSIMKDPRLWDHPDEFIPERFSGESLLDFRGQNFQYIPFSSGRRSCPGSFFGVATVELTLASLLYAFDWDLPAGMRVEDVTMREAPGFALHKKDDLYLIATPRV